MGNSTVYTRVEPVQLTPASNKYRLEAKDAWTAAEASSEHAISRISDLAASRLANGPTSQTHCKTKEGGPRTVTEIRRRNF